MDRDSLLIISDLTVGPRLARYLLGDQTEIELSERCRQFDLDNMACCSGWYEMDANDAD